MEPLHELGTHELVDIVRNSLSSLDLERTPHPIPVRKNHLSQLLQDHFRLDLLGLLHVLNELETRGLKNI